MKRRSKSSPFKKLLTKNLPPQTAERIITGWENTKETLQRWVNAPVRLVTNYLGDEAVAETIEPPALPEKSARSEEREATISEAKPVHIAPVRRMLKAGANVEPEPIPTPVQPVEENSIVVKVAPIIPQKRRPVPIQNTDTEPTAPEVKIVEDTASPMVNLPAIAAFFVDAESEDKSTYVRLKGETSWRRLSEPGASPFGPSKSPSPRKS